MTSFFPISLIEGEELAPYTTYGIGGKARYFAKATTEEELISLISWAKKNHIPIYILGKGSNTVFDDKGFNGLVILVKLCQFEISEEGDVARVKAGAGFSFARLGTLTSQKGWTGLEFASGIPGSVGGAVFMNAGASGSDTSEVLSKVRFMDPDGNIKELLREELSFSYRHSCFQKRPGIILEAEFVLQRDPSAKEKQKMILEKRIHSQPYDQKSAGCVFRNPIQSDYVEVPKEGIQSAGSLIDKAGLKGQSVGGVQVSPLHANFLVNSGKGTSSDLFELIDFIRDEIAKRHNITLQLEIRRVSYEIPSWWNDAVAR